MTFEAFVTDYMSQAFVGDFLLDRIKYGLLRDSVENCLKAKGFRLSRQQRVHIVLSCLFKQLVRGFDFDGFVWLVAKSERKEFYTSLLYHIYYINLTLEHLVSKEKLFYYLLRLVAAFAKDETISKLFYSLSRSEQIKCIGFCVSHFDEGAYRLFGYLSEHADATVRKLLFCLDRRLIDKEELAAWIEHQETIDAPKLAILLKEIDNDIKMRLARVAAELSVPVAQVKKCFSLFGFYGHQVPKDAWYLHEYEALDEKLAHLNPTINACNEFVEAIKVHIGALTHAPELYVKGFEEITYAMPTAGKDLSRFAWVPSISASLRYFCNYFKIALPPVFVLDQSNPTLYAKNWRYMRSLYPDFVHLNTDQIVRLAKKLQIEGLLRTGLHGEFGYGGARNAIFLLAPLLKHYYKESRPKRSSFIDFVLSKSSRTLKRDFQEVVLEEKHKPCVVHMGDDDVHIPVSTIFSDALFSYRHQHEYFCRFGWVIGRRTTWTETTFNLEYVLQRSPEILLQHAWQEEPFSHGMAGLLTKPKLCMNLPFGQEEAYLQAMKLYSFDFRLPSMHLSGYRFPKVQLPRNRLSGLAQLLEAHYRYSLGMMLVADLIDPTNSQKKCALPWNNQKKPYTNLLAAIRFMQRPTTTKALQKQFWKNAKGLAHAYAAYTPVPGQMPEMATLHMGILRSQHVKKIMRPLKEQFPDEVKEFEELFMRLASDAKAFQKLLANPKMKLSLDGHHFTQALYLLFRVAGSGGFQSKLHFI